MSRALEQARVDVEDVAGEGLAAGRAPEQEGYLTVGAGVMGEIIIDDEHVAPGLHEMLGDAGRGVRRDVGEPRRVVALGHDDDGVVHRVLLSEGRHRLGHGGGALADGAVDAKDVFTPLVQDGVERDGRLARLPITEDQLALAAPDGDERVEDLEASLDRHGDGRAVHDGRGGPLDGQARVGVDRALPIERPTERIDDPPQQPFAHGDVHDPASARDLVAGVQVPALAEEHDADLVRVHVERDAEHAAGELQQLVEAGAGEAGDGGDAGGHRRYRAHLTW